MKDYERKVYLNNAATSWPKPDCVATAVSRALRSLPGDAGRGGIREFNVFEQVREKLGALLGISCPERIALGSNSTWGLNQAVFGFPLEPGDRVLTTKAEHNAVLRPLYRLEKQGIQVIYLDVDKTGRIEPEQWKAALRKYRPRLCVLIHASNVTGAVNDAQTLTAMTKDAGAAMLLDVSQSLGWIPVELENGEQIWRLLRDINICWDPREPEGSMSGRAYFEAVCAGRYRGKKRSERDAGRNASPSGSGDRERAFLPRPSCRPAVGTGESPEPGENRRNPSISGKWTEGDGLSGDPAKASGYAGAFFYNSGLEPGGGRRYFIRQL